MPRGIGVDEKYQKVILTEEGGVPFLFVLIRRWGALVAKLSHKRLASPARRAKIVNLR